MNDMIIGVDLAKSIFQVHGALMTTGEIQFKKKLTREQFRMFMLKLAPSVVIFEACGSANYWAGQMEAMGHHAKLIAPQFVRPFVKRHKKNDAADADAIIIAARQPEMLFVTPKSVDQQARAALFRGRERLISQRTENVNALRAVLYEHGHVFPIGIGHIKRMQDLVETEICDLPSIVREECSDTQGACLFMKRLEKGRFVWPAAKDGKICVTAAQLSMLLEGIDWRMPARTWRPLQAG